MKTLEELLKTKVKSTNFRGEEVGISPEFRVSVQQEFSDGGVLFIIHPYGHNGDTLDLVAVGNTLYDLSEWKFYREGL